MTGHLMLLPSLACPAQCAYCFGPRSGDGTVLSRDTLEAVVDWQQELGGGPADEIEITFHGGEPLVAGAAFYRMALPLLRDGLAPRRVRFAAQSNLWLLDYELCELFAEHRVSLGTSLDGPQVINDAQRGDGYYARTMAGIEQARKHGLDVGCICTFTAQSAPHAAEIVEFFAREALGFSVHATLPSLQHSGTDRWSLTPEAYGELLVGLLERYLDNLTRVRIGTLDSMARGVSAGQGGICTFEDCLGHYLTVRPDGTIYPCQRFAGLAQFGLGNVAARPGRDELRASPVWQAFRAREQAMIEDCGDCPWVAFCRGGCPYNALAAGDGRPGHERRDPYCEGYRRTFAAIVERATAEMLSSENLDEVVRHPDSKRGLLRRGRMLSIMRPGPHPYDTAGYARRIAASVALAGSDSVDGAVDRFERLGLAENRHRVATAMAGLQARLAAPAAGLNNLYLHVTFACNLHCSHCYAKAGPQRRGATSPALAAAACREASRLGFCHVVITGGEPLLHPERDAVLDALAAVRGEVKPLLTVLRTALAVPLSDDLVARLARSTDEVVVSVDGDRETHDSRRGAGTYDVTVANLRALVAAGGDSEVSLAAVLPLGLAGGPPGDSVRALAKELGVRRTRFRPLLPLGRALDSDLEMAPTALWSLVDLGKLVAYGFSPVASCGMGQNIYVEPDGEAYPCYAWHGPGWRLGSLNDSGGLAEIIATDAFQTLRTHTVDTNRACGHCALRYLCGGACRAWNRPALGLPMKDLDAPPRDCGSLHARARSLLVSALDHLGIEADAWLAAGLPLPDEPPTTRPQGGSACPCSDRPT